MAKAKVKVKAAPGPSYSPKLHAEAAMASDKARKAGPRAKTPSAPFKAGSAGPSITPERAATTNLKTEMKARRAGKPAKAPAPLVAKRPNPMMDRLADGPKTVGERQAKAKLKIRGAQMGADAAKRAVPKAVASTANRAAAVGVGKALAKKAGSVALGAATGPVGAAVGAALTVGAVAKAAVNPKNYTPTPVGPGKGRSAPAKASFKAADAPKVAAKAPALGDVAMRAAPEGVVAVPKSKPKLSEFSSAFAAARAKAGGDGGVFSFKGKSFTTNVKR